jgi:cytochrome P450
VTAAPTLPVHMQRNGFDPTRELAEMRDGPGIQRIRTMLGMEAWLVTRFSDVREVLGDPARFSNAQVPASFQRPKGLPPLSTEEVGRLRAGNLLASDPPDHTRLRRFLTPEFTVRRMRRLEPRIQEIVDEHLDAMERHGPPADLVAEFALPVPSLVICELLGVPYADRAAFQERSNRQLDLRRPVEERFRAGKESRAYMADLVARAQADPGEDMLGMLVREHGADLTTDELTGIASLLLIAGHETTANMLGLGTLALLRHPEQLTIVRDEPERVDAAVEELLRWLTIVHTGTAKSSSCAHCRPPTATRSCAETPTGSTSRAAASATSLSATASTTASGRRSPGWRCGSPSRPCCGGSPAWPRCPTPPVSAASTSSTV